MYESIYYIRRNFINLQRLIRMTSCFLNGCFIRSGRMVSWNSARRMFYIILVNCSGSLNMTFHRAVSKLRWNNKINKINSQEGNGNTAVNVTEIDNSLSKWWIIIFGLVINTGYSRWRINRESCEYRFSEMKYSFLFHLFFTFDRYLLFWNSLYHRAEFFLRMVIIKSNTFHAENKINFSTEITIGMKNLR